MPDLSRSPFPGDGKYFARIVRPIDWIARLCCLGIMMHIVIDVTSRTLFTKPLSGTFAFVQYWWMPALTLLGMAVAQRRREHIEIMMMPEVLEPRVGKWLHRWALGVAVVFYAFIAWYGWKEASLQMSRGEYSAVAGTPIWPPRYFVPIAMGLLIWGAVREAIVDYDAETLDIEEMAVVQ